MSIGDFPKEYNHSPGSRWEIEGEAEQPFSWAQRPAHPLTVLGGVFRRYRQRIFSDNHHTFRCLSALKWCSGTYRKWYTTISITTITIITITTITIITYYYYYYYCYWTTCPQPGSPEGAPAEGTE